MAVNWGLAGQMPDYAAATQRGMERGRQFRAQNALVQYAQNPNEQSLNALADTNPEFVIAQKQQQAASQQAGQEKEWEVLGRVASYADTPEKWRAGMQYLSQFAPNFAKYADHFSEDNRMAMLAMADQLKAVQGQNEQYTLAPGSIRYDAKGNKIAEAPFAPRPITVGEGQTVVEYAPGGNGLSGGFDSFHKNWLAPAEGGYVAKDGRSGAPANFGINQKANPDIDVANLTEGQAAQLMHDRYWVPSGADKIQDPALQAIHADTAVNMGVGAAQGLLQQSGGDPAKYLQLREQRYRQIGGPDLPGWLSRNQKLAEYTKGGSRIIAKGDPKPEKPKWRTLTPQEAQQRGLPAGTFQESPDGEIKPLGGIGDKAPQSKEAYSQSAIDAFDRAITTANGLLGHKGFAAAVGSGFDPAAIGSFNPWNGKVLAGTEAANFRTNLETMKAQVFLPMVQSMKGMGALSNAEGEKLTAAIGNLSTDQSEAQFKQNVRGIIKDLTFYRTRAGKQGQSVSAPTPAPATAGKGPVRIKGDADFAKLKSGAVFIGPDGKVRRKP